MSAERHILRTIETISAATAGEGKWDAVGQALVALVGAGSNTLWVGDPALGLVDVLSVTFDAGAERDYGSYYHRIDLWTQRGAARPLEGPFLGTDCVSEAELRKSEVYTDYFRKLDAFHVVASFTKLGGGSGFTGIGLHRPERSRPFEERDKQALAEIVPYLRRSMRMRHELQLATGAANAAMAGLTAARLPALAVDRTKRILFANTAASSLLQAKRGLSSRAGRCVAADAADLGAVAALLHKTSLGGMGGLLRLRAAPGDTRLTMLATRPGHGDPSGVVIVLLIDPAARQIQTKAALLQVMYGLTRAEADVAEAATRGEAAAIIAMSRGTSEATIRAQLRAILAKTEADNLRVLSMMVAALPDPVG